MELVETFLVIFQASVSGLSRSDKEELAVHIIPEVNVVVNSIVLILITDDFDVEDIDDDDDDDDDCNIT